MAKELFGTNVSYDPQIDKLRRAHVEPTSIGNRPPSVLEMNLTLPKFAGGPPTMYPPTKPQRPGWVKEPWSR